MLHSVLPEQNSVMSITRFVPLVALLTGACATARVETRATPVASRTMAWVIDSIADAPPMQYTTWGIQVLDQQSSRVLYERNAQRHYIPASNTKLVVTTVAMGALGPDFRYQTPVHAAVTTDPAVAASVIIMGTGDPTMSDRYWNRPFAVADAFADSIINTGIRRIDGPLIIDASAFTDGPINGTWEVSDLPGVYAPPVGALAIDESIFRVIIEPGNTPGDPVTARFPDWPANAIGGQPISLAAVRTVDAASRTSIQSDFLGRRDTIYLSGQVAIGRPDTSSYAVTDPPMYAGRAIAAALAAKGVTVRDGVIVLRDSATVNSTRANVTYMPVAMFTSPPVSEIVSAILHPSQNWIAETLLKTLGSQRGAGGSWRNGLAVERDYLVRVAGIDSLSFSLRDGSGMAPQNLLSPVAIVRMLEHTRNATWGAQYRAALAAPGENGTLNTRLTEYTG